MHVMGDDTDTVRPIASLCLWWNRITPDHAHLCVPQNGTDCFEHSGYHVDITDLIASCLSNRGPHQNADLNVNGFTSLKFG